MVSSRSVRDLYLELRQSTCRPATPAVPLGRCLAAVAAYAVRPGRDMVVDDRSTDGTAVIARDAGAAVVPVPGAGGLGAARNLALETCRMLHRYERILVAAERDPDVRLAGLIG